MFSLRQPLRRAFVWSKRRERQPQIPLAEAEPGLTWPCCLRKRISCLSAPPEPCSSRLAPSRCLASCQREIGNSLPNNQRQRRTCYALCHILNVIHIVPHTATYHQPSRLDQKVPPRFLIDLARDSNRNLFSLKSPLSWCINGLLERMTNRSNREVWWCR